MRQGQWTEAIEILGEANPFRDSGELSYTSALMYSDIILGLSGPAIPNLDGGIKVTVVSAYRYRQII